MIKIELDKMNPSKLRKQMRFAAARALNDSAFAARAALVREVKDEFILRNSYTERGFRVVKAKRAHLEARVGTDREYLVDHVVGGVRKDRAIPTKAIRKRPQQRVSQKRWPGNLIERGNHFIAPGKERSIHGLSPAARRAIAKTGRRLVFKRGRGRKRKLKLLYAIPQRVRIRKTIEWSSIVFGEHKRVYADAFEQRLAHALATAR